MDFLDYLRDPYGFASAAAPTIKTSRLSEHMSHGPAWRRRTRRHQGPLCWQCSLPSMTTPSQSIEIYCFKCKAKTGSKDVQAITMKNDRPATRVDS